MTVTRRYHPKMVKKTSLEPKEGPFPAYFWNDVNRKRRPTHSYEEISYHELMDDDPEDSNE